MDTPRDHIDRIRKSKFSIGGDPNPLIEDLHQAVKNLSAELYAKDVHFLMELIQNAEDNEYLEDVDPSLEFVITSRDITGTGAPATLLIFNNERGFSAKNIESVCSVGRSTKKGNRKRGYIGEKGIGFKSVFLITAQPHIFSNGYQIRFDEAPCPHCNLGYIVPEWVEDQTLSDIKQIYGSASSLPTTTIVLPLKADKVKPVKEQLSSIHPEVLLFLTKIKRLSVKEDTEDPRLSTLNAISISRETNFLTRKNIDAESYTLYLSAEESSDKSETECSYYMWKQKFPVREENKVEKRKDAEELVITLAFPNGERLRRGMGSPGVYAFLPTEMVTNFPFIIQADFILASSREYILLNDKWNQGILNCVPFAFINAFTALVKSSVDAPISNVPRMFGFLPIKPSHYQELNAVRESIRAKLVKEHIIPSESYTEQKFFHKPCEVGRIMPTFWNILRKAREQGLSLQNLSSHGWYILSSSFDKAEYDDILEFMGVKQVDDEWYAKCIQGSDIVASVSDEVYFELLLFLANGWSSRFHKTSMKNVPLIKYVDLDGDVSFCSIRKYANPNSELSVCMSNHSDHISWMIDWNKLFITANCYFMPGSTQKALLLCPKREIILHWLTEQAKVCVLSVSSYADHVCDALSNSRKPIIGFGHFLYHSCLKKYLSEVDVGKLSSKMPLIDSYGNVVKIRNGVLVPASGSKWAELIGSNPWRKEGYIELGEDYLHPGHFAGEFTPREKLIEFLKSHVPASDIPCISPPNAAVPTASAPLTKENAFLLLDWIQNLKYSGIRIPDKFLMCLKNGSWLRVIISGSHGYRPPSQSFHLASSWGEILQNGSVLVDIPLIDKSFYGDKIEEYKDVLKTIGVMFDPEEAYEFIGNHFMSMLSSSLTRANVFSILHFIKFLREKFLSPDKLIGSIQEGRWLRTTNGERSPRESVLFTEDWKVSSQISNIPFIDQSYYGEEILSFKTELQLLGVVIGFNRSYQIVVNNFKAPSSLTSLTAEAILLILLCIHQRILPSNIVNSLRVIKCLKTNCGYKSPTDCFLFDPVWGCLLQVFKSFPLIDQKIYGDSIFSYKNELKKMGVVVDFEDAMKQFASTFKQQVSSSSVTKENVLFLLSCFKQLKGTVRFPSEFKKCIGEQKWLRTRLGDYRSPKDCILFTSEWKAISQITTLPFIADSDNYYGERIHEFKNELKSLGVAVEFKAGVKFVFAGLSLHTNACYLTTSAALSLLECIHLRDPNASLPTSFMRKVSQIWLKTHIGYKHPEECLLFDSEWGSYLQKTDGPFIDEEFYGSKIMSYKEELKEIGVTVDVKEGCPLLASNIDLNSTFTTIVRIYNYLSEFNWEPDSEEAGRIWIPHGSEKGEWVSPSECVLHDKDGLFALQLYVLEKHYDDKLLKFFSKALDVKSNPSVDDYCKLWKGWEISKEKLSTTECCTFWGSVAKNWSSKMERSLAENLVKIPATSRTNGILLLDKRNVFIADDLLLKDLFEQDFPHPIFVWYPQPSLPSLPHSKLIEIYKKIGVRTISDSVEKKGFLLLNDLELREVNSRDNLINRSLIKLVLGFLAKPSLNMAAEKRHEAVKCLLNLTVLETVEPISLSYSLSLSSGEIVNVEASRNICWDREGSKLFVQKMDRSDGYKILVEHATYFSGVISEGLLWEKEEYTGALSELIKLAFLVDFTEEALDFIMKSKNMQIFMEDEKFLASVFP